MDERPTPPELSGEARRFGGLIREYLFDLLPYLKEDAHAIARDEATLALAEIIGRD